MLVIRNEQMQALSEPRLQDFERRLVAHCRREVDQRGLAFGDEELAAQVKRGLAAGLTFFTTERDVARYCEIVLLKLGGWHTSHPADAIEILSSDSVAADVRLRNFEHWVAIQRR